MLKSATSGSKVIAKEKTDTGTKPEPVCSKDTRIFSTSEQVEDPCGSQLSNRSYRAGAESPTKLQE